MGKFWGTLVALAIEGGLARCVAFRQVRLRTKDVRERHGRLGWREGLRERSEDG
jgi:hypothetical protein